jgi:hypothetical protein
MKPPFGDKSKTSNDFQTPPLALRPLLGYIKKDWTVWECACGKGNLVEDLKARGYWVIGTDIAGGYDFLHYEPEGYDCIITNPPYSFKQEFLERAYELGKPFAFLLPLTTFETAKRQRLFRSYGVEVIFLDKRINFETPSGNGSGSWFAVAWFTNGFDIGSQLSFFNL